MATPTDYILRRPFRAESESGSLVQDRPVLGRMPGRRRPQSQLARVGIDFVAASAVVAVVVRSAGADLFPVLPLAPALLVAVSFLLGIYARADDPSLRAADGLAWPILKFLLAGALAWTTSLITGLGAGPQLALWAAFLLLDAAVQATVNRVTKNSETPERWILVGDEQIAERLKTFAPLQRYARVVETIPPSLSGGNGQLAALNLVDSHGADRVIIATRPADDDEHLVALVSAFRSLGVPVSLLPRPLDLLESPLATPSTIGGVTLIDVAGLEARRSAPYRGPDRRLERKTKVSVVVPALNEGRNIGNVLERLPEDLHEVILVDGNSQDDTVEAARRAVPGIKVQTQTGRGKGDALRTGFAAVTGNLIVMLDADGSADPAEIPRFVEALERGADFAKGSRFLEGGGSADLTPLRRLGNRGLSAAANLLHGTRFTDLCYGYNAFWTRVLPFISLDAPGFEVETLINLRVAAAGMRVTEVPSFEASRVHGHSNLKTFPDGARVLSTIIREARHRPPRAETSNEAPMTVEVSQGAAG